MNFRPLSNRIRSGSISFSESGSSPCPWSGSGTQSEVRSGSGSCSEKLGKRVSLSGPGEFRSKSGAYKKMGSSSGIEGGDILQMEFIWE